MGTWKYWDLHKEATDKYNNLSESMIKKVGMFTTNQQLLTIRQLIEKRKEQHKKELKDLYEWESNVAKSLQEMIKNE